MSDIWIAFGLTVFAGMGTGIGSVIAFTAKRTNYRFLSISTGFSAGVMLYVSFVEIFYKGVDALVAVYGETAGQWVNAASFFGGMFLIGAIDNLTPSAKNPHEVHEEKETAPLHDPAAPIADFEAVALPWKEANSSLQDHSHHHKQLLRMGLFTALAIAIHNFPEGISVSVPIFYATGNRKKAFTYSLLSGLSEPVGAAVAYLGLRFFVGGESGAIPSQVMGVLFAGVAGIMVYISLDELLPTSRAYAKGHDSLLGLMAGMIVMALSLLLMK